MSDNTKPPDKGKPPSAVWWRETPINRDSARVAVESAAAELEDTRLALMVSLEVVKLLARTMPPRFANHAAERRLLGWMLSGRATLAELEPVTPYDFTSRARRALAAFALELLAEGNPALPCERSTVFVMLDALEPDDGAAAESEIGILPYPRELPTREMDLVVTLGRGWSVTEDAYRGAE